MTDERQGILDRLGSIHRTIDLIYDKTNRMDTKNESDHTSLNRRLDDLATKIGGFDQHLNGITDGINTQFGKLEQRFEDLTETVLSHVRSNNQGQGS